MEQTVLSIKLSLSLFRIPGYAGWRLSVTEGLVVLHSCDDPCDASPPARRRSWAEVVVLLALLFLSEYSGQMLASFLLVCLIHGPLSMPYTVPPSPSPWLSLDFHIAGHCISDCLNKLLFINFKLFKTFLFLNGGIYCYKFPSLWLLLYTTDLGILYS